MDSPPPLDLSPMQEYGPVDNSPYVPNSTLPFGFDPVRMVSYCKGIRSPPSFHRMASVQYPSPLQYFDYGKVMHPESSEQDTSLDSITRNLLRPCCHCKLRGPAYFCVLSMFGGEIDHMVEQMEKLACEKGYNAKTCRMILYYKTGMICLGPFRRGTEKRIPHCIVRKMQCEFPDSDGRQALREQSVYMGRTPCGEISLQGRERPWTRALKKV